MVILNHCCQDESLSQLMKHKLLMVLACLVNIAFAQSSGAELRQREIKILATLSDDTSKVLLLSGLSYQFCPYKPDSAYLLAQESLALARSLRYLKGEILALRAIAMTYSALNDFGRALKLSLEVVELYKQQQDAMGLAKVYNNIADLFMRQNSWQKALDYMKKSQANYTTAKSKDPSFNCILLSNLGMCYYNLGEGDSARFYLHKAIVIGQPIHHFVLNEVLLTLGDVEFADKKYAMAINYYQQVARLLKGSDNYVILYETFYRIAHFYHHTPVRHHRDSTIHYAQLALNASQKCSYLVGTLKSSSFLSQVYEHQNDTKALYYFKIATLTKDSLNSQERVRQLLSIEFDEKQKTQEHEIAALTNKNRNRFIIALGILILLSIIVLLLYNSNHQQHQAYKILQESQQQLNLRSQELRGLIEEKDALLREIHHRVKNNLEVISSLLTLQANSLSDDTARMAISEGQSRVQSIALIHHTLYQNSDLASVELSMLATNLFGQVKELFQRKNITIEFQFLGPSIRINTNTAILIGLILNELFTNAFKYAILPHQTNQVTLELRDTSLFAQKAYMLLYRDNGPGLPADFDIEKSTSLGIRVIRLLTRQIKGHFYFHSTQKGAIFEIHF